MKHVMVIMLISMSLIGCASKQDASPDSKSQPVDVLSISEEEYRQVEQRILRRIGQLKATHPSLHSMISPSAHEYNVKWVLDDPTKPHSKLNGRNAVFDPDGYWFSLQFYRGPWKGSASFRPIEFGDLKLWFRYGHADNSSVIAAVTTILRQENEAFCQRHPWQRPNQALKAMGEPAPWRNR